jgi:hypothetical protein
MEKDGRDEKNQYVFTLFWRGKNILKVRAGEIFLFLSIKL